MKSRQHHFVNGQWRDFDGTTGFNAQNVQLVLAFGSPECVVEPTVYDHLRSLYPNSNIIFASTAGEIIDDAVYDDSVVVTAMEFAKTKIKCVSKALDKERSSYETGRELMQELDSDELNCVFVISDGAHINGSELVAGFNENNTRNVPVTGGLAGDAARFAKTFTALNAVPTEGNVIAVGFYGKDLLMGHGSFGGWDEFGHERTITRAEKNVLYEIDGKNALQLYKEYLGDYVNDLPGSALLFPLSLRAGESDGNLVRTILSVSEADSSMTFAGNMPEGSKVRLMKANFDKIIEGSSNAADFSFAGLRSHKPEVAILISCVGRKLILQHRIDEEIQAAKDIFGDETVITGFYSYGEISPLNPNPKCELHNQTMTITTFTEL